MECFQWIVIQNWLTFGNCEDDDTFDYSEDYIRPVVTLSSDLEYVLKSTYDFRTVNRSDITLNTYDINL